MTHHDILSWYIWGAVVIAEAGALVCIVLRGAWRRWPSLGAFLLALSARDMVRLADYVLWRSPALEFWSFYWLSLAAECAELWMIAQIILELAGATAHQRRWITEALIGFGSIAAVVSLAIAFHPQPPAYLALRSLVLSLDQTALYLFLFVALIGSLFAEWSGGVRGIAAGFAVELGSASSASWLYVFNHANPVAVAQVKSALYMVALAIWIVSTWKPTRSDVTDYVRFLPIVDRYAQIYFGLAGAGLRRVIDKK